MKKLAESKKKKKRGHIDYETRGKMIERTREREKTTYKLSAVQIELWQTINVLRSIGSLRAAVVAIAAIVAINVIVMIVVHLVRDKPIDLSIIDMFLFGVLFFFSLHRFEISNPISVTFNKQTRHKKTKLERAKSARECITSKISFGVSKCFFR